MADVIEQPTITADDQAVLDRVAQRNDSSYVADNYNEDGTPKGSEFQMPEKFQGKTAEEIAKSYIELEKMKANTAPLEGVEGTNPTPATNESPEATKEPTEAPTPFLEFEQEFVKEGKLSEASYKKLEAQGFTKTMVDNYVEGQSIKANQYSVAVFDKAGGETQYQELLQWATTGLQPAEIEAINADLTSGDVTKATMAVELMNLRRGTAPTRLDGSGNNGSGVQGLKPFSDKTQYYAEVRNPMYGKDKKFTEMVDSRYLASKRAGLI